LQRCCYLSLNHPFLIFFVIRASIDNYKTFVKNIFTPFPFSEIEGRTQGGRQRGTRVRPYRCRETAGIPASDNDLMPISRSGRVKLIINPISPQTQHPLNSFTPQTTTPATFHTPKIREIQKIRAILFNPKLSQIIYLQQHSRNKGSHLPPEFQQFFNLIKKGTAKYGIYLGRRYRLKIRGLDELQELPGYSKKIKPKETVKLTRGFFYVYQQDPTDRAQTETLIWNWYRDHASKLFRRRLKELMPWFRRRGIQEPPLNIRRMKKRWGSCTPSKAILLNTELIKAPAHCIDYVIVHELCHLAHPFHDNRFYWLLDLMMPDWRTRKERLEKVDI
jgi:predicted metal-dependent hydrolase